MMTGTYPLGALLAATLYQGNHDVKYKLWGILSAEIYTFILHMQVLLEVCYI
jgi:hypothetical protein